MVDGIDPACHVQRRVGGEDGNQDGNQDQQGVVLRGKHRMSVAGALSDAVSQEFAVLPVGWRQCATEGRRIGKGQMLQANVRSVHAQCPHGVFKRRRF
ncbi:hypothetical protein GCM10011430_00690 [Oxalicibacterium solurbis]|uniref:Uncharacterized protein n=1 Tax=Oxalicibacterium solurbis TaxID=69280 RepID=A0A8J3ATH3_9BURK|nr:hypothetical protein GCM10011430_00690 [Oxalicibacterium solurbis]